jgi:precorrin-4 methylase
MVVYLQVGYPTSTPVAVVERASTPNQRTLLGTVGTIADVAAR